jgi:hypothetical protein
MLAQDINVKVLFILHSCMHSVMGREEKLKFTRYSFIGIDESSASFEHSWNLVMYFEERQ